MFAAIYLANNINTEWRLTFHAFNLSAALTTINLIFQYLFGSSTHFKRDHDLQGFIIALDLEFILLVTGLIIGYQYGVYLCVAGGLIGFLMPLVITACLGRNKSTFPTS